MNRVVAKFGRVIAVGLAVSLASPAPVEAQEAARRASGDIIAGYSANTFQGNSTTSPYVGLEGDFGGYWKDPRILVFDIAPNFVKGFQWSGPLIGPSSNGFDANATFLGGSHVPFSAFFSRQNTPTFDFGITSIFRPTSTLNQKYGFDWSANFDHFPSLNVRYLHDDSTTFFPKEIAGDANARSSSLSAITNYKIAGWGLTGTYAKTGATAFSTFEIPGMLPAATRPEDTSDGRSYSASATRELPLRSHLMLDYTDTDNSIDIQDSVTRLAYRRASAIVSSRPNERLDTTLQATYLNDSSSYFLQTGSAGGSPAQFDPNLLGRATGILTAGATVGYRITNSLRTYGSYSRSVPTDDTATLKDGNSLEGSQTYSAGVSYFRKFFGGKLSTGYGLVRSVAEFNFDESVATSQTANVGYDRRIFWGMDLNSNLTASFQSFTYNYDNQTDNYSVNVGVRRKFRELQFEGRANVSKNTYVYPYEVHNNSSSYSFSLSSRQWTATANYLSNTGLSYLFGNSTVPVPGIPIVSQVDLINTTGHSWGVSGSYNGIRKLTLTGSWLTGTQFLNDVANRNYHTYLFKSEYKFRRVRLAAGFGSSSENYPRAGVGKVDTGYYYFQIRRDFRLF